MLFRILLIFSALLPLQLALNPLPGIDLASARVFVIFFFLFFLAESLRKKNLVLPNGKLSFLFFFFLISLAFSLFLATEISWGMRKLLFVFSLAPLFWLTSSLVKNKTGAEKIAQAITVGAALVSFASLLLFFSQFFLGTDRALNITLAASAPFLGDSLWAAVKQHPSLLVNIAGRTYLRTSAIFPDPHMFAFYLGMSAPLATALALHKKQSSLKKIFFSFSALLIFAAWLLTFSRGAYLAIVSLSVFLVFFLLEKRKLALILAILFLFLGALSSPVGQRFLSSFDLEEGSNRGRLEIWKHASQTILANPFGVGIGNYPLKFSPIASYRDPIYAHNAYLDIAVEAGIVSLALFCALLFAAIRLFWSQRQNLLFAAFGGSLLVFASHCLVETPLYSVHIFSFLMIILGIAAANINIYEKGNS